MKNYKDDIVNGSMKDTRQAQWEKVFTSCFLKVDDEVGGKSSTSNNTLQFLASETVGSTAVVAVVCSSHIVVANCGDSRAVLYRGKEAIPLSVDHKVSCFFIVFHRSCPVNHLESLLQQNDFTCFLYLFPKFICQPNREDEYARIEACGGKVIQWNGHRVLGVLAMSRSIGESNSVPY